MENGVLSQPARDGATIALYTAYPPQPLSFPRPSSSVRNATYRHSASCWWSAAIRSAMIGPLLYYSVHRLPDRVRTGGADCGSARALVRVGARLRMFCCDAQRCSDSVNCGGDGPYIRIETVYSSTMKGVPTGRKGWDRGESFDFGGGTVRAV